MTDKEELIEIYKLHVTMTDRISQRRGRLNQFFLTLISGMLSIFAFTLNENSMWFDEVIFITIGILGIFICILWFVQIQSYKKLNSAKFDALNVLEEKLLFSFYSLEWKKLTNEKSYKTLTSLEKFAPVILMCPFVVILFLGIVN